MTKFDRHGGGDGQPTGEIPETSQQEGGRPDHGRSGNRNVVPFRRGRECGTTSGRRRRDAMVRIRACAVAAGGRGPVLGLPGFALPGGAPSDRSSSNLVPDGVSLRYLMPGEGRRQCLCLIHDDRSGDIVAFGYGDDHSAARFAACEDLQA